MKMLSVYNFEFVENLSPVLDRNGYIKEFMPGQDIKTQKDYP